MEVKIGKSLEGFSAVDNNQDKFEIADNAIQTTKGD